MGIAEDPPAYADVLSDGMRISQPWFTWLRENVTQPRNDGLTVTVTLAKLTGGGSNGSLEFRNGILVAVTQPT